MAELSASKVESYVKNLTFLEPRPLNTTRPGRTEWRSARRGVDCCRLIGLRTRAPVAEEEAKISAIYLPIAVQVAP